MNEPSIKTLESRIELLSAALAKILYLDGIISTDLARGVDLLMIAQDYISHLEESRNDDNKIDPESSYP